MICSTFGFFFQRWSRYSAGRSVHVTRYSACELGCLTRLEQPVVLGSSGGRRYSAVVSGWHVPTLYVERP